MKASAESTFALAAVLTVLGTLLLAFAGAAQQPPAAPGPPAGPGPAVPPMPPGGAGGDVQVIVGGHQMVMAGPPGGGHALLIQTAGEHIYVIYGPYLCQFSTKALELESKINLEELLGLADVPAEDRAQAEEGGRAVLILGGPLAALASRTPAMQVTGEHVYVVYGPYLCDFSTKGLELLAQADFRQLLDLGPGVQVRILNQVGPAGPEQKEGDAPQPGAPHQP
jgi:hypothetical protein